MHDGAHGALFHKGATDRFVGFLCGLPLAFSCSAYRATHMLHHRYENTAKDPDNLYAAVPNKTMRFILYYSWYVVGMVLYIGTVIATGPFRAEGWKEKGLCVVEAVVMLSFYYSAYLATLTFGLTEVVLYGWLAALPFAMVIANIRGLAEHTLLEQACPPDPLKATRTTLSHTVISFFFSNQNYHLEHHLFPTIPWYNLPGVHEVLRPIYEARGASICDGYLQYVADAFRHGPMKGIQYVSGSRTVVG